MLTITKSFRDTLNWLGPNRARAIFFWLASTGLASLMLNIVSPRPQWVTLVQSLLLIAFLVGAAFIVLSRFPADDRQQLRIAVTPALLAVSFGFLFPNYLIIFGPMGIAWLAISLILIKGRIRPEYQKAIRHMRRNEFDEAIKVMNEVIQQEEDNPDHRRFRADLFRLSGKIKRARSDYEKVIELSPESAVGYNGLAEVYLQDGEYSTALGYAQKALELEPDQWVSAYNLGMIEERLKMANEALAHLQEALRLGVPDSRHRLLCHLWMARAHSQLGSVDQARAEVAQMKREQAGLNEWETIFEAEAAAVLRSVLESDVRLAAQLVRGEADLEALVAQE